ncbi:MAG TPA: transcriptional repressor LexA [Gammaproteobacteria bacterium]|nr:transcriptional repressor LexA [Gammaproteobacteria bacterium]
MQELTQRQAEILALIRACLEEQGMPPTREELARALQLASPNTVEFHLRALARKGYLELVPGHRNIRLKEAAALPGRGLPLVGRVAAGSPILSEENIEGYFHRCNELFRPRPHFLLRVQGMSMRDAGIAHGDLLAVHRTPEARDGQVVVARLDDEATVKRLRRKGRQLWLLPENPAFQPIAVDLKRQALVIEGIAVGVIRAIR